MASVGSSEAAQALRFLAADPLRNISLLKFIEAYPGDVEIYHQQRENRQAAMVVLSNAASPWDRDTYPQAAFTVFISSQSADFSRELLASVPRGCGLVFKLSSEDDHEVVASAYTLRRVTSFISLRATTPVETSPEVHLTLEPRRQAWDLLEARGYDQDWLGPLLGSGKAFVVEAEEQGHVCAVCFAFENYADVWEVGGLATAEAFRRRGHAARIVQAAFAELLHRGRLARYVAEETNTASLALARSLGLDPFLTLTHFLHLPFV